LGKKRFVVHFALSLILGKKGFVDRFAYPGKKPKKSDSASESPWLLVDRVGLAARHVRIAASAAFDHLLALAYYWRFAGITVETILYDRRSLFASWYLASSQKCYLHSLIEQKLVFSLSRQTTKKANELF
jgi:hypothetical protein